MSGLRSGGSASGAGDAPRGPVAGSPGALRSGSGKVEQRTVPSRGERVDKVEQGMVPSRGEKVERALEAVRRDGGRSTTTRRIVLEALLDAGDSGVTADSLAEHIRRSHPTFTSSTIYRCLERFEELGVLAHSHLGHGAAVWRLVDRPRWYLVCNNCGASIDADPALVESLSAELQRSVGFRLDGHFALTGRCAACP